MNIDAYKRKMRAGFLRDKEQADSDWAIIMEEVSSGVINREKIAEAIRRCNVADEKLMEFDMKNKT